MKWVGLWHILGRKSKRKAGQGGGSCCLRVWKVERRVFSRCRRHNWEWCARWGPGLAIWFCRIHQGSAMFLFTWLFFVCLQLHYFCKLEIFKGIKWMFLTGVMLWSILMFSSFIQKHKCVPLEDLAAEFKLRTQVTVIVVWLH